MKKSKMINAAGQTVLLVITLIFSMTVSMAEEFVFDNSSSTDNVEMITGPAVGETIPDFKGVNQKGELKSFDDIKGPNGAMIMFHRSADW